MSRQLQRRMYTFVATLVALASTPMAAIASPGSPPDKAPEAALDRSYVESFAGQDINDPHTQFLIGYGYTVGRNPLTGAKAPVNYEKSRKLLTAAADNGEAKAHTAIGFLYMFGWGFETSRDQAAKYFALAAAKGDPAGQTELGYAYQNGYGIEQDLLKAFMWLSLSIVSENPNGRAAARYLEEVTAKLSVSEIERAQSMVKACAETKYEKCEQRE